MSDLESFSKQFLVDIDKTLENIDNLVEKVALVADQAVVLSTPVDTGAARSNWIVQINSPSTQVISAYVEGKEGTTGGANAQAAIDQGQQVISNYQQGDSIHITNNLPYIGRLNDGSSAQAPANFVETGIQTAITSIAQAGILPTGGR